MSEAATHYRDAWLRVIYDATGDYVKAMELVEISGLFDPVDAMTTNLVPDRMEEVDKDKVIAALGDELRRCRELRAKLELQSMQAMDQLRAQIRALGAEPAL